MTISLRCSSALSIGSLALLATTTAAHAQQPSTAPKTAETVVKVGPAPITLSIQDGYELIELANPNSRLTQPNAIAQNGQVGGEDKVSEDKDPRAIVWSAQNAATFPQGNVYSTIVGFTPSGEAVGYADDLGGYRGFKGNANIGEAMIFGGGLPLGVGVGGKIVGMKYRFNNKGEAVGWDPWAKDDTLKAVPGVPESFAYGANAGVVVGGACATPANGVPTRPVRWEKNGTAVLLPGKGTAQNGIATSVNAQGVIVGGVGTGDFVRAARWDNDQLTELPSLGGKSMALGISGSGVIVGYSVDGDGDTHGVIFRGNKPVDLNTLIHRPAFAQPMQGVSVATQAAVAKPMSITDRIQALVGDWFVQNGIDVNDKGEIAALATKLGKSKAVLLRPTFKNVTVSSPDEVKTAMKTAKPPRTRPTFRESPKIVLRKKP